MNHTKQLLWAFRKSRRVVKSALNFWRRKPQLLLCAKFFLIFIIFWAAAWTKVYDPDFGWHLQAGNYIRARGIPETDLFSYVAGNFRWINHEWLGDVILSRIYTSVGYGWLAAFYAAMWTAALFIVKAHQRLIFGIITAVAMLPYAGVRATTWTVLCLAILLAVLNSKKKNLRYLLPGLFLIWANLHGGFFIGLGVLAFYILKEKQFNWLYILLACVLVTFANPYGADLYDEVFRTALDGSLRWQIAEWFPAKFLLLVMPFIFSVIWAAGFVIKNHKSKFRMLFSLSPIFFLASLSSNRNFPLFALVAAPELNGYYRHIKKILPKNLDWFRKTILLALPALVLLITAWSLYLVGVRLQRGQVREAPYPLQAVSYLQAHPCAGNIFNSYNYGGYLIWKLPGVPLYIDGRMPSWRDEDGKKYFDRYRDIENNSNAANSEEFKRYNIRCVIWPSSKTGPPMIESLKNARWQRVDEASNDSNSLWLAPKFDYLPTDARF